MADKLYKVIIEGTEGRGSQVFEAETPEELQEKFKQAQTHATAKIDELDAKVKGLEEQLASVEQVTPSVPQTNGGFDRDHYFKLLYADPVAAQDYVLSATIGMPVKDFMTDYTNTVRPGAALATKNAVNAAFVQKHPEVLQVSPEDDLHNSKIILEIIHERNWPYDVKNLEAAFALAKDGGKLKLPPQETTMPEITPPVPTTVTRPSVQANTSESEEQFLRTAATEDVRKYLEKKYASTRP